MSTDFLVENVNQFAHESFSLLGGIYFWCDHAE